VYTYNKLVLCSVALTKEPLEEPPDQSLVKTTTLTKRKEQNKSRPQERYQMCLIV